MHPKYLLFILQKIDLDEAFANLSDDEFKAAEVQFIELKTICEKECGIEGNDEEED
jgi:hypothetical protein